MQKVVGLKKDFDKDIYYFLTTDDVKVGDKVVVSIDDFQTIATVKNIIDKTDKFSDLSQIKRVASEQDLKKFDELKEKAKDYLPQIKSKSLSLGLVMKFVGAQYSLDGSKVVIVFSSEERVDFRQFLKELAAMLKTRIELKQIGQRDEVKVCGGVGPCGEQCCCARFLKDFEHVSVKMAKTQGLSLSPTKINGICGRLMCCLAYESSQYDEILSKMPRINSEIVTPNGKGTVVYNDILRERVSVKRQTEGDSFVVEDYALEELQSKNHSQTKREVADKQSKENNDLRQDEKVELNNESQSDENKNKKHFGFKKDKYKHKNNKK